MNKPFLWHLNEHWRYPELLDILPPWSETIFRSLFQWWQNIVNVMKGADLHPKDHNIQSLHTPQVKVEALT